MKINFKKLSIQAVTPKYSRIGDAGLDLTAISLDETDLYFEYGTGLSFEIPEGYVGLLFPRSSVSKTEHYLRNSVGVIDSNYRGEIKVRMSVPNSLSRRYSIGDRICQIIFMPVPHVTLCETNDLTHTVRGEKGFGSSDI